MEIEMSKPAAILGFESKWEISRGSSMSLPMGFPHRHLEWVLPDVGCSAFREIDGREISN